MREYDADLTTGALNLAQKADYAWCGSKVCQTRDAWGTTIEMPQGLIREGSPIAYYFHRDHLGSVVDVSQADGGHLARTMYSPYGQKELLSSDAAYVKYAGMRFHEPSGLYLTYYRAYDPKLGRWLSRDPIGEAGGLNLYGYVGCRPGSYTDPWGLSPEDAQRIYDGIGHCTRKMSREGLRLPAELRFINNSIPGKLDCGEQVEYLINKCLSKLTDLDDNWSFLPRSGWGHTWGMARSSNYDDPYNMVRSACE